MSLTVCLSGKSFQSTDNYIVQKLRLAAALYGVALQLEFVDAKDSTLHLKIDGDNSPISSPSPVHSQQNSILRYIFSLSPQVTGPESSLDRAQIDQWLEVSWNDIEVPLQTLLSLPTQALSEEEKSSVRQKCQQDIESHLQSLDNHLGARTFLVGERASLADVALFATFQAVKSLSSKSLPNVARWAGTLEHLPALSGTIASTHMDLPAGKWGRGRIRIKELLANGTEVIGKEVVLKGPVYGGDNGEVGGKNYPMAKKAHSLEFLREKAHLRPRSKDFFGRRCCLTVSGQLNVETHACALTDVYTFGPTFRAEFWMIEPEICFAELVDDMALAEDYVRYCAKYALEHCADDLHYFEHEYPSGEKGSEHERYITEQLNDDNETVAAMDIL
eukprot:gene34968-45253_t